MFYLTDGDIVSGLLETGRVVVAVSNNDADFVQNHRAYQLVGALNLNHNGLNIRGRLEKSGKTEGKIYRLRLKATIVQQQ